MSGGRPNLNRRNLLVGLVNLVWIVPLSIGLTQMLRFLRFAPPTDDPTRIMLGPPPLPDLLPQYVESARIWLNADAGGYFAVDAVCTHLGCIIHEETGAGYQCACHGSRFAADGTVLNGPATQPLYFLSLARDDGGDLVVDRAQDVDPGARLPLES